MIENAAVQNILENADDVSVVCEIYPAGTVPTADGFDPNDALDCFAAAGGISFLGVDYQCLVSRFGSIKKTIGKEVNSATVTFSNVSREISRFEFANGFEGLIMVVRLISRSLSVDLDSSQILFTGRCEKPDSGDKDSLTVKASFILGGLDPVIPRRKFGPDDAEGREFSDPEFEGFRFMPKTGSSGYTRIVKRGGFFGWWNKKVERSTIAWSNYSDLDANKYLPEVFGQTQIQSVLIGGVDVGGDLQTVSAFCEGEIEDFINVRSVDASLPMSGTHYSEHLGLVGAANVDNPTYVAPGYYSRTALVRADINNSAVDINDAPPDIVGVVVGRKMAIPTAGVWGGSEWTANPAAHTRFLLTDPHYFNLDDAWIDDEYATECYEFNKELIFNMNLSDFLFVEAG